MRIGQPALWLWVSQAAVACASAGGGAGGSGSGGGAMMMTADVVPLAVDLRNVSLSPGLRWVNVPSPAPVQRRMVLVVPDGIDRGGPIDDSSSQRQLQAQTILPIGMASR